MAANSNLYVTQDLLVSTKICWIKYLSYVHSRHRNTFVTYMRLSTVSHWFIVLVHNLHRLFFFFNLTKTGWSPVVVKCGKLSLYKLLPTPRQTEFSFWQTNSVGQKVLEKKMKSKQQNKAGVNRHGKQHIYKNKAKCSTEPLLYRFWGWTKLSRLPQKQANC